jgi:N-acetylglutamate synthase-like GNAT family acetyltransferase
VENQNLIFIKAQIHEINDIHFVLSKAFEPYRNHYTDEALNATILSPDIIKNRILNQKYEIFVVKIDKQIVGTVSLSMKDQYQLYIRSMAVHPEYQKRGIGLFILKNISKFAKRKNIKTISLETSKPLKRAINFYTNFGFKFTGNSKNFHGVEISEMKKYYP